MNWFWARREKNTKPSARDDEDSLVKKLLDEIANLRAQVEDMHKGQEQITHAATYIHQQMEATTESNSSTLQRLQFTSEAIRVLVEPEGNWKRFASDGPFFTPGFDDVKDPFLVPFNPDHQLLLWVADAVAPQASFGFILPRIGARLIPIPLASANGSTANPQSKEYKNDASAEPSARTLPEHFLALEIDGRNAPYGTLEAIQSFSRSHKNDIWLVRFAEDLNTNTETSQGDTEDPGTKFVHITLTPQIRLEQVPHFNHRWNGGRYEVLFFASSPGEEWASLFQKQPVLSYEIKDA